MTHIVLAPEAVIYGVDFPGPRILAVNPLLDQQIALAPRRCSPIRTLPTVALAYQHQDQINHIQDLGTERVAEICHSDPIRLEERNEDSR